MVAAGIQLLGCIQSRVLVQHPGCHFSFEMAANALSQGRLVKEQGHMAWSLSGCHFFMKMAADALVERHTSSHPTETTLVVQYCGSERVPWSRAMWSNSNPEAKCLGNENQICLY